LPSLKGEPSSGSTEPVASAEADRRIGTGNETERTAT
jgi:hypothetical protein